MGEPDPTMTAARHLADAAVEYVAHLALIQVRNLDSKGPVNLSEGELDALGYATRKLQDYAAIYRQTRDAEAPGPQGEVGGEDTNQPNQAPASEEDHRAED